MASFGEEGKEEEKKVDSSGENEKKDFRGSISFFFPPFLLYKILVEAPQCAYDKNISFFLLQCKGFLLFATLSLHRGGFLIEPPMLCSVCCCLTVLLSSALGTWILGYRFLQAIQGEAKMFSGLFNSNKSPLTTVLT